MAEAKTTVMSDEQIVADMVERYRKWDARGTPDSVIMNKILVNLRPVIRREGIKEVVDSFIEAEIHSNPDSIRQACMRILQGWHVKLKAWGMEEA